MQVNFDQIIERQGSDSAKWQFYGDDVLPMWVADMDFPSPAPVLRALHQRIDHGFFGYGSDSKTLKEVVCARMARLYDWQIEPDDIVLLPGLVCGLNAVTRASGEPGDGVLVTPPIYPPFLSAPPNQGRERQEAIMAVAQAGQRLTYTVDYDAFEAAIQPNTRLFMLCNPHNPVGRAYSRAELLQMARICLRHDLTICADEIHSDLMLDGNRHIPMASLDPEIAARTITLLAPSKTYNLPGLGCSLAIIQNATLRANLAKAMAGIVPHVNTLGVTAAIAAYSECEDWLDALRVYLTGNRDFLLDFVSQNLPALKLTSPEGTYLGWIDCSALELPTTPQTFFLNEAKVALSGGAGFGAGSEQFVRLNFGCPRPLLRQGLEQMQRALAG